MLITVYGLIAPPLDPQVRYVGVTKRDPARRLSEHIQRAKSGERTHKATWIRKMLAVGVEVQIKPLAQVPFEEWQVWEQAFIAGLPNVTNSCEGGEGLINPTLETRQKMSSVQRAIRGTPEARAQSGLARRGKTHTEDAKAKMRAAALGRRHSPEARAKIAAAQIGKTRSPHSDETKAKMSAARRGVSRSAETRARMSEAAKLWRARKAALAGSVA